VKFLVAASVLAIALAFVIGVATGRFLALGEVTPGVSRFPDEFYATLVVRLHHTNAVPTESARHAGERFDVMSVRRWRKKVLDQTPR